MLSVHHRRALERQLRFYIFFPSLLLFIYFFFYVCFFFVCSFFSFSHIACNLVFRAVCDFAWYCVSRYVGRDAHRPPIGSVKLLLAGLLEMGSKFSIRTDFLGVPADLPRNARGRVCRREIMRPPHPSATPFFISVLFSCAISHARKLYITSLI